MADLLSSPVASLSSFLPGQTKALPTLPKKGTVTDESEARKAAKEFEIIYLQTVLAQIIPEPSENFFGGGSHGEKLWSSFLNEQYAKTLSEGGGIGIADAVYKELISIQEGEQPNGNTFQGQ